MCSASLGIFVLETGFLGESSASSVPVYPNCHGYVRLFASGCCSEVVKLPHGVHAAMSWTIVSSFV